VKTIWSLLVTVVAFLGACPLGAEAEDGSWKLPNLNPFSTKGQPPTAGRAGGAANTGLRMPSLWPKSASANKPTQQPTMLKKMTTSSKQFFAKTADAINPWDDANDNPLPNASGSRSAFSQATTRKKKEEPSRSLIPASWWSSDPPDDGRDKNVNDFLSRPRPGY
jgi:hypothetical protein